MASHASAVKAHRQSLKRRTRNRQLRGKLRAALKNMRETLGADEAAAATPEQLRETVSLLDKMAGKGVIHANTAARYKSRLTKQLAGRSSPTQ